MSETITQFWARRFRETGPDGVSRCALCLNTGKMEIRDREHWCICPNGRQMARDKGKWFKQALTAAATK